MVNKGLRLKALLPWWFLIAAKVVLARLPLGYSFWKRLGLFEHGDMNQPARALENYQTHSQTGGFSRLHGGFNVLEVGPGDSLFTALIAKAHGASQIWLVDAGPFATTDPKAYDAMAHYLESQKFRLPFENTFSDFHGVLQASNAIYLTEGVNSFTLIPDHSVDFCLSNAVLEHIPLKDFPVWRVKCGEY
jgi:hypothetical protein